MKAIRRDGNSGVKNSIGKLLSNYTYSYMIKENVNEVEDIISDEPQDVGEVVVEEEKPVDDNATFDESSTEPVVEAEKVKKKKTSKKPEINKVIMKPFETLEKMAPTKKKCKKKVKKEE